MSPIHILPHNRDRCRDKALLIGFEYRGSPNVDTLDGVHEEVELFRQHLIDVQLYLDANVKVVKDGDRSASQGPSCRDVERAIKWLISDAKSGDRLVFYFAGHGYQLKARPGSRELDGRDEAIMIDPRYGEPVGEFNTLLDRWTLSSGHPDLKKLQGIITDNRLKEVLVDALPAGVQLCAFWDTCHSGTLLDLPCYWCSRGSQFKTLSSSNFVARNFPRRQISQILSSTGNLPSREGSLEFITDAPRCFSPVQMDENLPPSADSPLVISISSSEDYQSTFGEGKGSMIRCIIEVLEKSRHQEPFSVKTLMSRLEKEMCQRRVTAYDAGIHKKSGRHVSEKERCTLKDLQCPLLGSLIRLAPDQPFTI